MALVTMLASPSVEETATVESRLPESRDDAASITGHTSQWRPDSPASEPSPTTRSNSPLLDQWVRRQQALFRFEEAKREAEHDQVVHSRSLTAQPELEHRRGSGSFKLTMATRTGSVRLQRLSRGEDRRAGTPGAGTSAAHLTRDEFESLPPAVQRKVSRLAISQRRLVLHNFLCAGRLAGLAENPLVVREWRAPNTPLQVGFERAQP
jgi:hypothetical protein